MLLDPHCFILFIEANDIPVLEYVDNWADGVKPTYHFLSEDLVIDMRYCIDIDVAELYLRKIDAGILVNKLNELDCPCSDKK